MKTKGSKSNFMTAILSKLISIFTLSEKFDWLYYFGIFICFKYAKCSSTKSAFLKSSNDVLIDK